MTKKPDISVFLPSGCLSLESIQKYMDGGFSENDRAKIANHLKECRFCHEAFEGLALIPDPFKQKTALRSLRQGILKNMRNRGKGRERKLWPGRKINVAAIAAGIILLTGIFTVYTFLLKTDQNYLAEEHTNRKELFPEKESIPVSKPLENTFDTNIILLEQEKPEIAKKSKIISQKNMKATPQKQPDKTISNEEIIPDEDITVTEGIVQPALAIAVENSGNEIQPAPIPEAVRTELPKFKSADKLAKVKGQPGLNIKESTTGMQTDSLIIPVFITDKYKGFNDYLMKNLKDKYPSITIPAEGKILVTFLVTRNGNIRNVHILRGHGTEIDKALLQLIKNSPNWSPAIQKGQKSDFQMQFTVNLKNPL